MLIILVHSNNNHHLQINNHKHIKANPFNLNNKPSHKAIIIIIKNIKLLNKMIKTT